MNFFIKYIGHFRGNNVNALSIQVIWLTEAIEPLIFGLYWSSVMVEHMYILIFIHYTWIYFNIKRNFLYFRCTFGSCKVRFTTEDNLKYHEKCHFENRFQCIEFDCQFTDMKWLSMMSHLWKTHKIDIEMFSCNQCEFKTNRYKIKINLYFYTTWYNYQIDLFSTFFFIMFDKIFKLQIIIKSYYNTKFMQRNNYYLQ